MPDFDLLYVCTGNICRSPTAERLTTAALEESLGPESKRFRVHSAGTYGLEGWPIEPNAARCLSDRGVVAEDFRARRLTAELVARSDLVLCATREHRADVVRLVPRASGRTFTIRQFAALTESVDPAELGGDDVTDRARALVAAAAARRGMVPVRDEDIADPYGSEYDVYEQCATEIAEALRGPLRLLAPAGEGT